VFLKQATSALFFGFTQAVFRYTNIIPVRVFSGADLNTSTLFLFPALYENVKSFNNAENKNTGGVSAGRTLSEIRCSSVASDFVVSFFME
jgi:hypothetical protein